MSDQYRMQLLHCDTSTLIERVINAERIAHDNVEKADALRAELDGVKAVLGEMVSEAYTQCPFGDDDGMNLLYHAKTLLGLEEEKK